MTVQLKLLLILPLLSVVTACHGPDKLINLCGQPCYEGPTNTLNIGICHAGKVDCSGIHPVCIGQQLPIPETCDNQDNNCNGIPEDNASNARDWYVDSDGDGYGSLLKIIHSCHMPPGYSPNNLDCDDTDPSVHPGAVDICNNKDDNCNGEIDENIDTQFCYTGDPAELEYPDTLCHAGVLQCIAGQLDCMNEILPQQEVCDGVDNDCDGLIDEGFDHATFDFVFVLDESGSMGAFMGQITQALTSFALNNSSPDFKYGLILAPDSRIDYIPHLWADLEDAKDFINGVNVQQSGSTSYEPMLDALLYSCNGDMRLSWRPDSKKFIIFFSDEQAQTYATSHIFDASIVPAYDAQIDTVCSAANINLIGYTIFNQDTWPSSAIQHDLNGNSSDILLDLELLLGGNYCK